MTSTKPSRLISGEYIKVLQQKITREPNWGGTGGRAADWVQREAKVCEAESILDYGCGNGSLGKALKLNHTLKTRKFAQYDPGRGIMLSPTFTKADLVVCLDVMEHVEEDCVEAVLDDINTKTAKVALFWVATGPAVHKLPDGRNAHITIKDKEWWLDLLRQRFDKVEELTHNRRGFKARCSHAS